MFNFYTKNLIIFGLLSLNGCSVAPNEDFTNFVGDPVENIYIDDKKIKRPIHASVSMPEGDNYSKNCRLSGTISLPDNMTYSQYIQQILTQSLRLSDRLANEKDLKAPRLKIEIKNIVLQSYQGQWSMEGTIYVNDQKITTIFNSLDFETDFDNNAACSQAIDSFDNMCRGFISKALYHPKVLNALNKFK